MRVSRTLLEFGFRFLSRAVIELQILACLVLLDCEIWKRLIAQLSIDAILFVDIDSFRSELARFNTNRLTRQYPTRCGHATVMSLPSLATNHLAHNESESRIMSLIDASDPLERIDTHRVTRNSTTHCLHQATTISRNDEQQHMPSPAGGEHPRRS